MNIYFNNIDNVIYILRDKVVKTNMTRPFCVGRHIGICLNVSIASVKMDAWKKLLKFRLPPLWLVIKNGFQSPTLWWSKCFGCQPYGDWGISIAKHVMTKKIHSPIMRQLKFIKKIQLLIMRWPKTFGCHMVGDWNFLNHHLFSVSHYGISIYIRKYIKAKEELWKF